MTNFNPIKVPNIVVSLLNRTKDEAIQFVNSDQKTNFQDYMFRVSNDNIVSFSHSYNFDKGQGENIGNLITLEVIDPENVFEKFLFANSDTLLKSTKDVAKAREKAGAEYERLIKIRNALNVFGQSPYTINTEINQGNLDLFNPKTSDYQKVQIQDKLDDELVTKLTTALDTAGAKFPKDLAKQIINKAKEKRVLTVSSTEYYDVAQGNSEVDLLVQTSAVFQNNSLSSIYADFNLDNLEKKQQVLPTPYFYFYYGLNDNPYEWAGPISAQFTDAKYNYSWETGKKSITMNFTTTFDFPIFSRLALDVRGYDTIVTPEYYCTFVVTPTVKNSTTATLNKTSTGTTDVNIHTVVCNNVIKNFLKKCTSDEINILVILPDLKQILDSQVSEYLKFMNKGITGGSPFERDAALVDVYTKIFEDMGFSTTYARKDNASGYKIGDQLPQVGTVQRNFAGFAQENNITTYLGQGAQYDEYYVGIGLSKELNQSYKETLDKIRVGIQNKISLVDLTLEMIDDTQFTNDFIAYLNSISSPLVSDFKANAPILVFGDRYIIEKYLYGKKFYITNGLLDEKQKKTVSGKEEDLSLKSLQAKYSFDKKNSDEYLYFLDKEAFSDNYINTLAKKYFLKVDDSLQVNSSIYSFPKEDFSLDVSDKALASLRQCRIPIFKSGLSESNLLNVDLNFNDFYFAALRAVWGKVDQLNLITGDSSNTPPVNINDLKVFNSTDYDKIKNELLNNSITKSGLAEVGLSNLFEILDGQNSKYQQFKGLNDGDKIDAIQKLIQLLSQDLKKGGTKLRVVLGSHTNTNTYIQYLSLFSKLVNNAYLGYIKTLPSFHIHGTINSTPPILLLLEEINTIPYVSKSFITRALNGLYKINGFKHTISSDEIFSEFFINKSIQLDLPLTFEDKT